MMQHKFKIIISMILFLSGQTAWASPGFETAVNNALGGTANVSCDACHDGGTTSSSATFPMALTWKNGGRGDAALLASTDSDGDGFSNKHEANAATTNFNLASITPFTLAAATTGADIKLPDVLVEGSTAATQASFTNTFNQTLAATEKVLGGIAVEVDPSGGNQTLLFKAGGADTNAKVYAIGASSYTALTATTDYTIDANTGKVTIKALPAGLTPPTSIFVIRTTPSAENKATLSHGEASVTGCMSNHSTLPLLMFFTLLAFAFLSHRQRKA